MKKNEKEIARILGRNPVPGIKEEAKAKLKREMEMQMERLDILPWNAFPDRLLRQIPYITSWVWAVQALVVVMFAVLLRQEQRTENFPIIFAMLSVGPLLALLLVVDVARSFGCNMWEMEAACRYDLRRVTAMRMCIVGGADAAVLAMCCCFYGKGNGSIWEFGLFTVLPFLASSSIYLWELNRFSGNCSIYALALTGIGLNLVCCPALYKAYFWMLKNYLEWAPVLTLCALGLACAVMMYYAVLLCRHGLAKEGEREKWNLELKN